MSAIRLTSQGELAIRSQLALLSLPDNKKIRFLNRLITRLRTKWRRNITSQTDISGSAFKARKHKKPKQKRKMLAGLSKYMSVTSLNAQRAILGWKRAKTAIIAGSHNKGMTTQGNAEQLAKYRNQNKGKPCTNQQVRRLRTLNYQIPAKGGRTKRPTAKWIADNVTYDQAGLIIRLLSGIKKPRSWQINTPKREFFGVVDRREENELIALVLGQVLNSPT